MTDPRAAPEKSHRIGVYVCHCGTNIAGAVTSVVANLTVTAPASTQPTILTQPADLTVFEPNSASFIVWSVAPPHLK